LGVAAALAAALCWTLASALWRHWPTALDGARLNLLKTLIALAMLLPPVLLMPWRVPGPAVLLLGLSGVVGIAAGDSLFFAALRRLGTRRTLTVDAAAPAVTTLAALVLLGERPDGSQLAGIALISLAVLLVVRRRSAAGGLPTQPGAGPGVEPWLGPVLALGALLCGGAGALLARAAWQLGELSAPQAAAVRLGAAAVVLVPFLHRWPRAVAARSAAHWGVPLVATLLGTVFGIVLQQLALGRLGGGPAVALMATAPLMALPLAPLEGDRPGWSGLAAAFVGLLGISLVAGWPWRP
jgi:drug/metabolite transporter (DMT)-like permease